MKKTTFSVLSLFLMVLGVSNILNAQNRRPNFRVDAPAAIQGYKILEEMPDDGTWGTFINGKWENVPVAYDQNNALGCGAYAPGYFTGKFALIFRGTCEFGSKAKAAQTAGAAGVIIVNNLLGVAGMAAGADGASVTIPVIMVSTQTGNDIRTQLLNNVPVSVSLTAWRYDSIANPVDIGFKNDGPIHPLGKAMPVSQLTGTADDSFRVYSGGIFYNYSVANIDTINVQGRLDYKNTYIGGTYAPVDSNFINFFFQTPITTLDSLLFLQLDSIGGALAGFDMNNAAKGMYRMDNRVLSVPFNETGLAPLDNQWVYTFAVTDSIYSKCEYDFSKNTPVANHYINVLATNTYDWGPMFYIRNGSYRAEKAQVVIMRDVIDDSVFTGEEVLIELRKWDDADLNGAMDLGEIDVPIAQATYQLTGNDVVPIAGLPITVTFDNLPSPGSPILLDANSKYWLTIELGGAGRTFTVGVDYYADYRANLNANVGQGNPLYNITGQAVYGGGFASTGSPSIALLMSKEPEGINDIAKFDGEAKVYPNPATDLINIALTLNKLSSKVTYEIVDINGKSIAINTKSNIKTDNVSFNTSKLSNGTYFVKIVTESGKTQLKFTVAK
jgi:hypothetical protein